MFGAEDLLTFFRECHCRGDILSLEELFDMAVALWNNYCNPGAFTKFVTGYRPDDSIVPIGKPWGKGEDPNLMPVPKLRTEDGAESKGGEGLEKGAGRETKGRDAVTVGDEEFLGDRVLARSAAFMHEVLVSKEVAQAVAEGDVGRVYEGIKVSVWFDRAANSSMAYNR